MPWPTHFCSPDVRKPFVRKAFARYRPTDFSIFFSKNVKCDAKMIIPVNSESYRDHNIHPNNPNMFSWFFLTISFSPMLVYTFLQPTAHQAPIPG